MNKFQKLFALYQKEHLSKTFFHEAYAGIRRILKRNYLKFCHRVSGIPNAHDLASNDAYCCHPNAPDTDKVLYLTFDVEWKKPENVGTILDTLNEKQVSATFFLLGQGMERNADYVRRIRAEGHAVGNHTMSHPALTHCTRREIRQELSQCAALYRELTGEVMPKIMRPPYGEIDAFVMKTLHRFGYKTFLWNMHVYDWKKDAPATWEVFKAHLDTDLKTGSIILQHTFSDETAAHIGKYIDYCRAKGYHFASLTGFPAK